MATALFVSGSGNTEDPESAKSNVLSVSTKNNGNRCLILRISPTPKLSWCTTEVFIKQGRKRQMSWQSRAG
jgi:hypothetical protein